jgi:uncharacterized protein (TIGR02996 family)
MQKHPDADAFMRAYLAQPTDATSRLIFADWLEETGPAHNAAWAHYIRLQIEADHHSTDSREWRELTRQADEHAPHIRAKLVLSAKLFVGYPKSLLQLLPGANITVRLSGFEVPRPVLEVMPESVARENLLLPLDLQGRTLLVAATDPHNVDTALKLEFILDLEIVLVRGKRDDVQQAINREYAGTETEWIDVPFVDFEDAASPFSHAGELIELTESHARLVSLILTEATHLRADRVLLYPDIDAVGVRVRVDGEWVERDRFPIHLLRPLTARIASLAQIDVGRIFGSAPGVESLRGEFATQIRNVRFRFGVTILPSPDGPTTQINITGHPVA